MVSPITNRIGWDYYFLLIADMVALRSTCPRRQVGAVFVGEDNGILATGYNGAPRGMPHCDHSHREGHTTDEQRGIDKNGNCITAVHAEANALYHAARHGISLWHSTLYCTCAPCRACFHALVQAGVHRIVYVDTCPYFDCSQAGVDDMTTRQIPRLDMGKALVEYLAGLKGAGDYATTAVLLQSKGSKVDPSGR